jgi:histidine triad (HIT) family protein
MTERAPDDCLFCAIVRRERDAAWVFEDESCVGFLDHRPLFVGHTLIVPRRHCATLGDLPDDLLAPLLAAARLLAGAVEEALEAHGTLLALNNKVSQSVAHLHLHVIPRRFKDGLKGFFWPRQKYDGPEHVSRIQSVIAGAVRRRSGVAPA